MNPMTRWECGECATLHEDAIEAERCCPPTVYEVWLCASCETRHNYPADAEQCCSEQPASAEDAPLVTAAELEAAGQGRLL